METNEARQYKSLKAMPLHIVSKSIKHLYELFCTEMFGVIISILSMKTVGLLNIFVETVIDRDTVSFDE